MAASIIGGKLRILASGPRRYRPALWHTSPEVVVAIRRLNAEGITLLLIEQFVRSALEAANQAYVMERGALPLAGTPEELRRDQRVQEACLG